MRITRSGLSRYPAHLLLLLLTAIGLLGGCGGQPAAPVEVAAPTFSDPKISAPTPQEPGKEIGIAIDVSSASGVALEYNWSADGGEIVRGQNSPAITYRTPDEPGVYFVRVAIKWGNNSVEKMTSIQVEAPAVAAADEPPADTSNPEPETGPSPTVTRKPTRTPKPTFTPTHTPGPTRTRKPISTPTPTPPPTATSGSSTATAAQISDSQANRWWAASGHADAKAEAFVHWNNDSPAEVPVNCAKCHSMPGFLDFLGADGSRTEQIDSAAPIGTVLDCDTCHNSAAEALNSVVMPSGRRLTNVGAEAVCMQCHQGRESMATVNARFQDIGISNVDAVYQDLGFVNVHYFAAAATLYGSQAQGGYEYAGRRYVGKFEHDAGIEGCVQCHNSHSLQVNTDACGECHPEATGEDTLKNIRTSPVDYDGDGNTGEGIYYEMTGLQELLYRAIVDYSEQVVGQPIIYAPNAYPYFFVDAGRRGEVDDKDLDWRYDVWTPRLLKAAYNYQVSVKDPGAFTHNAAYIMQLLYDSLTDLNSALDTPADLSYLQRAE